MVRYSRIPVWAGLVVLGFVSCVSFVAQAQTSTNVSAKKTARPQIASSSERQIQARRRVLFLRMLEAPDDLDAAFEYAGLSIQAGDLEAAISTLERMLIFSPGLPRLQLELGLLYFRLSAYETARAYFEAAISGPDVPEEVRARVQNYLDGIHDAGKKTRLSGQARVGVRYQTNANRGPEDDRIVLNGLAFRLNPNALNDDDANAYAAGSFHVSHTLPQQGTSLEFDLVAYAAKQFQHDRFDIVQAEATFGPAFDLGRFGWDDAALGIYGIASGAFLHQDYYATYVGAGARIVSQIDTRSVVSGKIEHRSKFFRNSVNTPRATDRDGHELRSQLIYRHIYNPMLTFNATATGVVNKAARGYLSYMDYTLNAGPTVSFSSPFKDGGKWVLGTSLGISQRVFDAPDPLISTTIKQRDLELFARASLNIPIKNGFSLLAETEYRDVHSNYALRKHDNITTTISFVKVW